MNLIMKLLILSKNKIKKGILTIAKEVWIDGVNDTTNTDIFAFTVNGETITASVLNPGTIELEEGVYEVVETDYGDYIPDDNTLEAIVVKQGALVKFVNRFTTPIKKGILTIVKEVWIDGVKDTTNTDIFAFTVNGENLNASVASSATIELNEGIYEVVETGYGDYVPDDVTLEAIVVEQGALVKFVNRFTTPLPTLYQEWTTYPNSPELTEDYPYQIITQFTNGTILIFLSETQIYLNSSGYVVMTGAIRYKITAGPWTNRTVISLTGNEAITDLIGSGYTFKQANKDVYQDNTFTTKYFEKTTPILMNLANNLALTKVQDAAGKAETTAESFNSTGDDLEMSILASDEATITLEEV